MHPHKPIALAQNKRLIGAGNLPNAGRTKVTIRPMAEEEKKLFAVVIAVQ